MFSGIVKTATKNFPKKEAVKRCPELRGSWCQATARVGSNEIPMIAMAWRDKKVICMISTCGTTNEGSQAKKRRYDDEGKEYTKLVKRPKLYETYFDGSPAIDVHNHLRQDGLALEKAWETQSWKYRIFASLLGIIETNAYLAFKYFSKKEVLHAAFTESLAHYLIFNTPPSFNSHGDGDIVANDEIESGSNHFLKRLASVDSRNRKRVQRKCVVCSEVRKKQQKASFFCVPCGINRAFAIRKLEETVLPTIVTIVGKIFG